MNPLRRSMLLGALTPLMLAASPALAHASSSTSSQNARTAQTITRFYDHADRFTVREGFNRIESQRLMLRPFYETFITDMHDGTLGFPINEVEAGIYDGVVTYAQAPLIAEEQAAARQVEDSTSGTAHHNAQMLEEYFTAERDASTSLHARYSLQSAENDRFFEGFPRGIATLMGFVDSHRRFLARDVDGGDPFRSVEPALTSEQRTETTLRARVLSQTVNGLGVLTSQIARGWEGKQ